MCAYCAVHGEACRRTRAAYAGPKPGQGRPLGYLAAWLLHAAEYTAVEHSDRRLVLSRERRVAARHALHDIPNSAKLFEKERGPPHPGEDGEPDNFK